MAAKAAGPVGSPVDLITVGQGLAKIDRLRAAATSRWAVLPSIGMPITAVVAYLVVRAGLIDGLADAVGLVVAAAVPPVVAVLVGAAVVGLLRIGGPEAARRRIERALSALSGVEVQLPAPAGSQWTPRPPATARPAPVDRDPLGREVPRFLTGAHPPAWTQVLEVLRPWLLSGLLAVAAAGVGAVGSWLAQVVSLPEEIPWPLLVFINLLLVTTLTTVVVLWLNFGAHRVAWPKGVRSWLDLWASADPVSNGSLATPTDETSTVVFGPARFETREVVNHHSALLDHTSYHRNDAQVLALVIDRILPRSWKLQVGATAVSVVVDAAQRCRRLAAALWFSRLAGWVALPMAALLLPEVRLIDRLPIDRWVQLPSWAPMAGDVDRLVVAAVVALVVWLGLSAVGRWRVLRSWCVHVVHTPL